MSSTHTSNKRTCDNEKKSVVIPQAYTAATGLTLIGTSVQTYRQLRHAVAATGGARRAFSLPGRGVAGMIIKGRRRRTQSHTTRALEPRARAGRHDERRGFTRRARPTRATDVAGTAGVASVSSSHATFIPKFHPTASRAARLAGIRRVPRGRRSPTAVTITVELAEMDRAVGARSVAASDHCVWTSYRRAGIKTTTRATSARRFDGAGLNGVAMRVVLLLGTVLVDVLVLLDAADGTVLVDVLVVLVATDVSFVGQLLLAACAKLHARVLLSISQQLREDGVVVPSATDPRHGGAQPRDEWDSFRQPTSLTKSRDSTAMTRTIDMHE